MSSVALLASPGVGLRSVAERLSTIDGVVVHDVEDRLVADDELWTSARLRSVPPAKRSMRSLVEGSPREMLLARWGKAYSTVIDDLRDSQGSTSVVSFHPSLYSGRRSEFYSTLAEPVRLTDHFRFDHIVLLIDDIYDVQRRLGSHGDIYHLDRLLSKHLASQDLARFMDGREAFPAEADAHTWFRLRAENLNAVLSHIISWRRFDMVHAELLARAHDCRLTVLGVKHPLRALANLVLNPKESHTAYLSHPISRPRRALRKGIVSSWPPVVASSNTLGDRLAHVGVELVMPTAIDEFRLEPAVGAPFDRPYRLADRWPLLSPFGPIVSNDSPANLALEPSFSEVSSDLLGVHARSLEKAIVAEVPFRDHFLVSNTDAFFVYRPLFGLPGDSGDDSERGGSFSGGVQAEIDHWVDSWSPTGDSRSRRALFVHCESDLREVAWLWAGSVPGTGKKNDIERQSHAGGLGQAMRERLRDQFGLKASDINDVLTKGIVRTDMLDSEIIDSTHESVADLLERAFEETGKHYLLQYLTGGIEDHHILASGDVAVLLIASEELSDDQLSWCAEYLRGAHLVTDPILDDSGVLERALGVSSLAEWVRRATTP